MNRSVDLRSAEYNVTEDPASVNLQITWLNYLGKWPIYVLYMVNRVRAVIRAGANILAENLAEINLT